MAEITTDAQGRTYRDGVLQAPSGSPGFSGAVHDLVQAVAGAIGPKSITQRQQKIKQGVDQADPQPSDLGNQF